MFSVLELLALGGGGSGGLEVAEKQLKLESLLPGVGLLSLGGAGRPWGTAGEGRPWGKADRKSVV